MPSITTHYQLAKDLYEKLEPEITKKFKNEKNIYLIFAQSHDWLYYNTFNKRVKNIGSIAHKNNTQSYLINIVKYIIDNNLQNNEQIVAYLYGSITHYALDTTAHPYIFYKTGACNNDDPSTYKYRGLHTKIEKDLDALTYEKNYHKEYKYCNLNKDIIGQVKFKPELKTTIDQVFQKTYSIENVSNYFESGIKEAKILNALFINDRFGLKRILYLLIEFVTKHRFGYLSSYSTHLTKPDKNYLNKEKKTWNNPCNKELTYNYSFQELYDIALEKSLNIINNIHKVLYENQNINILLELIPNLLYSNGLPIEDYSPMRYFEF